jgi:hypothetical protein
MWRAAADVRGEMRCAAAYMRGTASSVHGRRVAPRLLRRRRVGDARYCQRACQQCGRQASGKFQHELSSTVLAPLRGALLNFATPYSFAGMAMHTPVWSVMSRPAGIESLRRAICAGAMRRAIDTRALKSTFRRR